MAVIVKPVRRLDPRTKRWQTYTQRYHTRDIIQPFGIYTDSLYQGICRYQTHALNLASECRIGQGMPTTYNFEQARTEARTVTDALRRSSIITTLQKINQWMTEHVESQFRHPEFYAAQLTSLLDPIGFYQMWRSRAMPKAGFNDRSDLNSTYNTALAHLDAFTQQRAPTPNEQHELTTMWGQAIGDALYRSILWKYHLYDPANRAIPDAMFDDLLLLPEHFIQIRSEARTLPTVFTFEMPTVPIRVVYASTRETRSRTARAMLNDAVAYARANNIATALTLYNAMKARDPENAERLRARYRAHAETIDEFLQYSKNPTLPDHLDRLLPKEARATLNDWFRPTAQHR